MGALPKRRISTGRKGRRRSDKNLTLKASILRRTTTKVRRAAMKAVKAVTPKAKTAGKPVSRKNVAKAKAATKRSATK